MRGLLSLLEIGRTSEVFGATKPINSRTGCSAYEIAWYIGHAAHIVYTALSPAAL